MQEHLFNLNSGPEVEPDGAVTVRPNVWLLTEEETPPLLLSFERTAQCLGVNLDAVEDLLQAGELSRVRIEGVPLIPSRSIARYVARLQEAGQP